MDELRYAGDVFQWRLAFNEADTDESGFVRVYDLR